MNSRLILLGAAFCLLCIGSAAGTTFYVDVNGTNPVPPYADWSTAATNIQDAVDASTNSDLILVTDGIYAAGGRPLTGYMLTNRVVIDKPVTVQSANGATATIIQGYQIPGAIYGAEAIRCVYLTNGASLVGFTLTNGATLAGGDDVQAGGDTSAAGILCSDSGATVSNCVVVSNSAGDFAGGAYFGTFYNCLFFGNQAPLYGGATLGCGLYNCTLTGNSSSFIGSGDAFGTLNNCIVYGNDPAGGNYGFSTLNYCCTTPDPGGMGNITNDPAFVDFAGGNFHLQSNSPCINSGNNAYVSGTDLDGNPRTAGGTVDIGAYEFQNPRSIISYAWLQQFGLPTDGSVDYTNLDSTGFSVYQDWIAGLDPTNAASVLVMSSDVSGDAISGITVTWQSVDNRTYYVQRAVDLTAQPAFSSIQSNLVGQAGTTSFTDTTATNGGPYFYRVGVQ